MNRVELEERTKRFHINIITVCSLLPKTIAGYEIGRQLIRSGGSVGANYRASKRAKSSADFIHKIQIVVEEADETHYWLTIIRDAQLLNLPLLDDLIQEAYELTAIFSATDKTAKQNNQK